MKILRQFAFGIFAVSFIAASAVMSFAGDPPSRVARLNYVSGEVSMQPGGVNDWAAATINRPMTTADRLWTDKDSRAELHLGGAAMRMDSETSLTLSNLSDDTVQLELDEGTLNLQVAHLSRGEIYEVDTPNTAFTIERAGSYRFDVDSRGDSTLVTVWRGKGIATGSGQAVRVESRTQVEFTGGMSMEHADFRAPRVDGFDEWCQTRADREAHSISVRYVSPDVIGYEDLDQYGYWRAVPAYGNVWFPTRVEAEWAPYRFGHWAWVDPWGWTWVDDAAWGFAPFHYGRWVTVAGTWGWVPGPVTVRPCYAPALVAWVGGSGFGVNVGWFPLGYGEPYIPSYRVSRNYFETVNVSNTRIANITYVSNNYYNNSVRINNIHYVNQTTAITIVNNDVLVNSRRVDRDAWADHDRDRHDDHDYRVMAGPSVQPSYHSVMGIHGDHSASAPPERVFGRRVVENVKPPERPVSFETRHPDADDHRGHQFNNGEDDRMSKHMPVTSRPDQDARGNGNSQDRSDQQKSYDDRGRDSRNSVADEGRDYSSNDRHPSRQGGDDRNDGNSARGNHQDAGQQVHNSNGDDRDDRNRNAGTPPSNGRNWDRGHQGDSSADGRFPHPQGHDDDDRGQQTSSGGYQPNPKQPEQNPNGNDGDHRNNGNGGIPQSNSPNFGRGQQSDSSGDGRFPHPGRRGDENGQQQTSAGGNQPAPKQADQNPNDSNGQGHNGNAGMPGRGQQQTSGGYQPAPKQADQNPNGNGGQGQNDNAGMWNNPNRNRGQQSPDGGYQPAPKQAEQNPNGSDGQQQRPSSAGNGGYGSSGAQGNSSSPDRQVPRPSYSGGRDRSVPMQQPANSPSSDTRNSNASVPPQSSYNGRNGGSTGQAVDRPMTRPSQAQSSDPHPAQPAPRMAQAQPASHSESHTAPSKSSGSNANAHGNALQDHGKTPQEH
jgi:hypothetical protein